MDQSFNVTNYKFRLAKYVTLFVVICIVTCCKTEKPMPHYQTKYHTSIPFDVNNRQNMSNKNEKN